MEEEKKEETTTNKNCLQCGTVLHVVSENQVRNFCSKKCRLRYHAKKRYHDNKDNPEFIKNLRESRKAWLAKKTPEELKAYVKGVNSRYQAKLKEKLKQVEPQNA